MANQSRNMNTRNINFEDSPYDPQPVSARFHEYVEEVIIMSPEVVFVVIARVIADSTADSLAPEKMAELRELIAVYDEYKARGSD